MAERGIAEIFALRVEARIGARADREVARRRVRIVAMRHRDRRIAVVDAGLAGRLERNRRQEAPHVTADPALDEAELRRSLAARGAIEVGAVEPAIIDIGE